jgi:hypothetical protein
MRHDKLLEFTAVTSSGQAFDIRFPLHEHTRSDEGVSDLLTALLDSISSFTTTTHAISDGDILQALAMSLAVRARMVDETGDTSRPLLHELVDSAVDAASDARAYQAARA